MGDVSGLRGGHQRKAARMPGMPGNAGGGQPPMMPMPGVTRRRPPEPPMMDRLPIMMDPSRNRAGFLPDEGFEITPAQQRPRR